ncbi:MAG TPA: hypothetical protein ENJ45_03325, partial [Phaeodactylibacter sp.]|nr:hypothetical protein [Phaeodactylibacter sp.]
MLRTSEPHNTYGTTPNKSSGSFVKKGFKKLLKGLVILMAVLVLAAVIIAAFFEKQVSDRLLSEINKQLKTELRVTSFDLSLLASFPDASAILHGVYLDDALEGVLVEAEKVSFNFGLFSLFGSSIKVHGIEIEDGALFIRKDGKGRANYAIVKNTGTSKGSSALAISLEEARFRNVELIYVNEQLKQEVKVNLRDAVLSGEFSAERFALDCFAELKSEFVEINDQRSFVDKDIVCDATIDVDLGKGRYLLQDVDMGVESNMFKLTGMILSRKKRTDFDVRLTSEECSLATMFELLPEAQQEYFSDFRSSGTFLFDAIVKGTWSSKEMPAIKATMSLSEGTISSDKLGHRLKDVSFDARFHNGKSHNARTSVFEIKNFKGYFNRELFTSKLKVHNLNKPVIDLQVDGVLPLSAIYGLWDDPRITDGDGEIEINDFHLKGKYSDMINPARISRVKSSGSIEFDDAALTINKEELTIDRGAIQILDNSLQLKKVKIEGAGSELYLSGKLLNLLPVLLSDSLNSQSAELKFQTMLNAPKLNLNRIEKILAPPPDERMVRRGDIDVDSVNIAQNQQRERITKFLKGSFQAKIDEIVYRKIKASDFSGKLQFDNNEMNIKGRIKGMDGAFNIDGTMVFEEKPFLKAKIDCEDVDLRQFFDQCENFGMEVLQAKNVKGTLNSQLAVSAFWSKEGDFLDKELAVIGDIRIAKGELIRLEMLYDFADYIKLRDLKHIKFTTLHNYFEIKKGKLYIP